MNRRELDRSHRKNSNEASASYLEQAAPIKEFDKPEDSEQAAIELFSESQADFENQAGTIIKNIVSFVENTSKTNASLAEKAESIPDEQGNILRKRIQALQERVQNTFDHYAGNATSFAKVVLLAGTPLFISNYNAAEEASGLVKHEQHETFEEMVTRAKRELAENGITSEQRNARTVLSESLYKNIYPWDYGFEREGGRKRIPWLKAEEYIKNAFSEIPRIGLARTNDEIAAQNRYFDVMDKLSTPGTGIGILPKEDLRHLGFAAREDAWRFYLGLPQTSNTFDISSYQPSKHKETKYYYKINGFWENLAKQKSYNNIKDLIEHLATMPRMSMDPKTRKLFPVKGYTGSSVPEFLEPTQIMGEYFIDMGRDKKGSYIAYYDKWDLSASIEGTSGLLGKQFEIYDRIYYDPETFNPIP